MGFSPDYRTTGRAWPNHLWYRLSAVDLARLKTNEDNLIDNDPGLQVVDSNAEVECLIPSS